MCYLNSNLAREVCRLADWGDKVWARRYRAIEVSDEPEAQRERMKHILAHGVKEFLVEKVRDWPGVHAARALLDDEPLEGLWFDRTQEYGARRRGEEPERNRFATPETVTLSPLPCWEHLSPEDQKEKVADLVREIEEEAAAQRAAMGKTVLGRAEILKQHPHQRPNRPKKSYAPLVHAASRKVRLALCEGYRVFVAAYREAADRLRAGERGVIFPVGKRLKRAGGNHLEGHDRPRCREQGGCRGTEDGVEAAGGGLLSSFRLAPFLSRTLSGSRAKDVVRRPLTRGILSPTTR